MSKINQELFAEALEKTLQRSAIDEAFRALCLKDMHAAIKEEAGLELPQDLKINVVDNTGYHMALNLPVVQQKSAEDEELDEKQLEAVSGGVTYTADVIEPKQWDFGNLGIVYQYGSINRTEFI